MSAIAYVNGRYVRRSEAVVSIEDRGNQFADAVYEACEIHDGELIDVRRHLDRLDRSLAALGIPSPMSRGPLVHILREVARRNGVVNGHVYLQVSRGAARRLHTIPPGLHPTIFATASKSNPADSALSYEKGVAVVTVPETRWDRVDIKTVGLLPNCLAKETAKAKGAREAFFVDRDGFITEGGSSNVWIITRDGVLVTRPADHGILRGITRTVVLDVAAAVGVPVEERRFTVEEAKAAREVFFTSASNILTPVVSIDGEVIGNGAPGLKTGELRGRYRDFTEKTPIW